VRRGRRTKEPSGPLSGLMRKRVGRGLPPLIEAGTAWRFDGKPADGYTRHTKGRPLGQPLAERNNSIAPVVSPARSGAATTLTRTSEGMQGSAAVVHTKAAESRSANLPGSLPVISRGLGKSWEPGRKAPDPRRERQPHEWRLSPSQRLNASRDPPGSEE
jgi:hypothetical protein